MQRPYDPRVCGGGYGITGRGPFVSAEELQRGAVEHGELAGFSDDARTAITVAPDYFVKWYTLKSVGLVAAVAALAFMIGRSTKRCR